MSTIYDQHADYWLSKRRVPSGLWSEIEPWTSKGLKALDLGCGGGRVAANLVPYFAEVCGIDNSSELLQRAAKIHPKVQFVCGDFQDIVVWNLIGKQFDIIVSNSSIRQDRCDLSQVADLCYAHLNSGGAVVFRMQGYCDLPGLIPDNIREEVFYTVGEINSLFYRFRTCVRFERYRQRFSSPQYVGQMLVRIGVPYFEPKFSVYEREYYVVRAIKD